MFEEQILEQDFRKKVIEEILGPENTERKKNMKQRYDVFKDGTKQYVLDRLQKEIGPDDFEEAKYRVANISLTRKIIDKKAMVFKDGANRTVEDSPETEEQVASYVDWLNHNTKMKKVNKYLELFRNCAYGALPYLDPISGLWKIRSQVLAPYLYDVIEDTENPEIGRVWIFSYFLDDSSSSVKPPNHSGLRSNNRGLNFRYGDDVDQIIADSPDDAGSNRMEFVWWSTKYHFTTDVKGEYVTGENKGNVDNPIGMIPYCNFAKDQDGQFWAIGGEDLIDGAILINQLLTDLYFVAKLQGQGIFYLIGPNVPETVKVGPSDAILMKTKEGDPDTQIGFASSAPPIESHMKMIEQYIALLLSTNNLEPGTVRGELSAVSAASGIQEMIRMSENIDDIEDQREVYRDNEPKIFEVIFRWHNMLLDRGVAHDDLKELGVFDLSQVVSLDFPEAKRVMSDKEKLEILEKRKDLGIDSAIDTIMRDNPDLSREEAEDKFKRVLEDKLKYNSLKLLSFGNPNDMGDNKEDDEMDDEAKDNVREDEQDPKQPE